MAEQCATGVERVPTDIMISESSAHEDAGVIVRGFSVPEKNRQMLPVCID